MSSGWPELGVHFRAPKHQLGLAQ